MKKHTCPKPKKTIIFAILALLISLTFGLFKKVKAQTTNVSYTISPPTIQFTLKPGEKTEKVIKITNHTENPISFAVSTVDFIVTDKAGTPELLRAGTITDNRFSAASWATALPDSLTVKPGETATTTLYLQVPGNARPGGRYFAVTFRALTAGIPEKSGAAVSPVAGSLVYLTVAGDMKEEAKVVQFSAPPFSEYGPIKFITEIQNTGDVHLTPKAVIEVKNMLGKTVFTTALANLNIFPGTSRIYENSWEQRMMFGKYTANLSGFYGQGDRLKLAALATFWVIPYKIVAIAVLALAIVLILVFGLRKKNPPRESEKPVEPTQTTK